MSYGPRQGDGPVERLFRLGLGRPDSGEAVEWEIEHYVAETVDRLMAAGWNRDEARREAERRFGRRRYAPRLRRLERRRVVVKKTMGWWEFVREGMATTLRGVRRQPGFAAGVIVTLALGIGANAAMFGIIDRLLLRPPTHVVEADAVKRVVIHMNQRAGQTITYPDFEDLRAHDGFDAVAAYSHPVDYTVGTGPGAYRAKALLVSWEFFDLLGAEPVVGRTFTADDDRPEAPPTVVVSHEYWRSMLGSDRGALGQTLELGGEPHTVIGVAPPGFTGVNLAKIDLWLPIEMAQYLRSGGTEWKDGAHARGNWWMNAVARVAAGTGVEAAEDQATTLHRNGRREEIEAGRYEDDVRVTLRDLIAARGEDASAESRVARWLGAVSLIVLLIACANVANLLLARSTRRRREVAVRLALGVSRARLVGQMMVEALVLALAGGALALALARWGGSVVRRGLLPDVYFPDAAVDARVVAFTVAASVLAGMLAGIGPAFQSTRVDVSHDLAEAGRGGSGRRSRTRSALVVAQATFSLVLLVGAGLFVRSLTQVYALDLGLDADRVVLASLELVDDGMELAEQNLLYERAAERLRAVPGVQSAAATGSPFQWGFASAVSAPGVDSIPRLPGGGPYYYTVTPDYFATLGLEVQLGRGILESDGPGDQLVAVISQTMAESLWPGESPLGRCLLVGSGAETCTEVVGVVEDASRGSLETDPYMAYYLPATQTANRSDDFGARLKGIYVRAAGDPDALNRTVAETLRALSPQVRYATARTLRDILDPQARSWKLGATMFSIFGLLALLVASVGLYSVLSFEVAQRTREIGIRSALGAGRSALLRGVVLEGLRLIVLGVVIGLAAAWLLAPTVGDLLFEVSPRDPAVLGLVAAVLLGAALLSGLVPGLRATRVDPATALRSE